MFRTVGRKPIKIALFSDFHVDYDSVPGSSAVCDKPICCRSDSGSPSSPDLAAGKWGDERCDLPERTMNNMLDYIHKVIQPDAALWGGDSIPHNIDTLNLQSNVEIMRNVSAEVRNRVGDIHVYPTLGNHDTYPQDVFKFKAPRQNEAINQWIDSWDWMAQHDEEQLKHLKDFGYYSLPLTWPNGTAIGGEHGVTKIISLNTNFCY